MFQPRLSVSFQCIEPDILDRPDPVSDETTGAICESRIAAFEMCPPMFHHDHDGAKRASFKQMLRRSGIRPMAFHALFGLDAYDFSDPDENAYANAIREMGACIDLAVEFDAPIIVVHASGEPMNPQDRPRRLEQARRGLAEIAGRCREMGRKIAIELLARTALGNTIEELFHLMDGLETDVVGVCLDTNHFMDRHAHLADDVRTLGDRLIALHLSDYDGVDEQHNLPGTGVVDWKALMQALADINYGGTLNYESTLEGETPKDRIASLENNFDWLCRLVAAPPPPPLPDNES